MLRERILLTWLGVLLLSGCAPMAPSSVTRQTLLEAASFDFKEAAPSVWPADDWWRRYGDDQLDALVEQALADNPGLAQAQARVALASAAAAHAGAPLWPAVEGRGGVVRQRPPSNTEALIPPMQPSRTQARVGVHLGYELDFFGRHRAALEAALSEQQAAAAQHQAARVALASEMVQRYIALQEAMAQHAVLAQVVAQRDEVLQLTRRRAANGLDTLVQVRQAESEQAAARVALLQARTRTSQLRHAVAALAGDGPARGATLAARSLVMPYRPVPDEVPLALLGRRADVSAARWRVQAALYQIDAARGRFYPNINLQAFIGFHGGGLGHLLDAAGRTGHIGPAITLPLFDAGALNAALQGREAEAAVAAAVYNEAVLTAIQQVADTLEALRYLDEERAQQRLARQAIDEAYRLARDRYGAGLGDYLSVLAAQDGVLRQAQLDTSLRYRVFSLDAQLSHVLGGGLGPLPSPPTSAGDA